MEAPWKHFQSNLAGYWHGFKPRGWVKSLKVKFAWYVVHWAEELSYNLLTLEKYVYSWSYPVPETLSNIAKGTTDPSCNFLKINQPSKLKQGVCKTKKTCCVTLGEVTLLWERLRGFRTFSETKFSELIVALKSVQLCITFWTNPVWLSSKLDGFEFVWFRLRWVAIASICLQLKVLSHTSSKSGVPNLICPLFSTNRESVQVYLQLG